MQVPRPFFSPHAAPTPAGAADDRALAERLCAGDLAAFEAIFRRYFKPLCAFAYGVVRSPETAEELVQDTLFRIWEIRESLELHTSLKSYLYKATQNRALQHLAHARVARRFEERTRAEWPHTVEPQARESTDDRVHAEELATAVERVVAELPERCRQAFLLSREHHLSYTEIAQVMGISAKTVELQIGRALRTLRERLGGSR